MTHFVAYDGSPLADGALLRARAYADLVDVPVVAGTVVPRGNTDYARERGWIDEEEAFDLDRVVSFLHERVVDLAPAAEFEYETVDRYAPRGTISRRLREMVHDAEATVVFVGSANAGRVVGTLTSVGASVAADERYDVHVVRRPYDEPIRDPKTGKPVRLDRSDFFFP